MRRTARRVVEPFGNPSTRLDALRLGMRVFLASLGVLFASTGIAFLVVRFSPEVASRWRGIELPWELLISTALLAVSGIACEAALRAIRRGDREGLARRLNQCLLTAIGFLAVQAWCWWKLLQDFDVVAAFRGDRDAAPIVAAWMFVVLTALHAAHVVGGIIPMLSMSRRAREGRYTSMRHEGIILFRAYWHFLGIVWVALALLLVATVR